MQNLKKDIKTMLVGTCMGFADIVPGVSGGTVAFILGIYEKLINSISRVDREFIGHLTALRIKKAAAHIDLRFLVSLTLGIGIGLASMSVLIHALLETETGRMFTFAAFFGMIAASAWVLLKSFKIPADSATWKFVALGILGAVISCSIALQNNPLDLGQPHLVYLFFCGMIGICAMILPGISGAMLLLLLGVYGYLTGLIDQLVHSVIPTSGEQVASDQGLLSVMLAVSVFGFGCLVGLLSFARVLRWLRKSHSAPTMSVLCGLMIGALPKVWPFQENLTPEKTEFKELVLFPTMPAAIDANVFVVFLVTLAFGALVIAANRLSSVQKTQIPPPPTHSQNAKT